MIDVSSNPQTGTCLNVTSTATNLKAALNVVNSYRGTVYYYPHRKAVDLVAACLEELGFTVTKDNETNSSNHIVLNDYNEDVCLQIYNSAASTNVISFLYPRHVSPGMPIGGTFNNGTSCRATIRMLGQGPGKIKTMLFLGSSSAPSLAGNYCIYFTEAKHLMTGEIKKAIAIQSSSSYYFYIYNNDWSFLPGFDSELTTAISMDSYWYDFRPNSTYSYYHDPYTSYKLFEEQANFPEIPAVSRDGMWEFPDIIFNPYGYIGDSISMKYTLTAGNIYQIGNKKYLCNYVGNYYYLFRVE